MLAANNLLKPSDGRPVAVPTQDMVLGSYYLTKMVEDAKGAGKAFCTPSEAIMAYGAGVISLHAPIKVRMTREGETGTNSKVIDTTVGRIIFNEPIPQDLGFVDRQDPDAQFELEVGHLVRKKELGKVIDRCISRHGTARTAEVLDKIKTLGFKYSTKSAITVSVSDAVVPEEKKQYLEEAETKIEEIQRRYDRGLISEEVRYERVIKTWNETTSRVKDAL